MSKKRIAGYRVHIRRLDFAADSPTTRTFKFPLVNECKKQGKRKKANFLDVPQELVEAVKHDDLYIRGPSNLIDYLKYKDKNNIYTLIDFWLDSLRAGVVFWNDAKTLRQYVSKIYSFNFYDNYLHQQSPLLAKHFKPSSLIQKIILKGVDIRKGDKCAKLRRQLEELSLKKNDSKQIINELVKGLCKDNNSFISRDDQKKYWKEKWKIDFKKLEKIKDLELTALIFPELALDLKKSINTQNILDILNQILIQRILLALKYEKLMQKELRNLLEEVEDELYQSLKNPLLFSKALNKIWKNIFTQEYRKLKLKETKKPTKKRMSLNKMQKEVLEKANKEYKNKIKPLTEYLRQSIGITKKAPALSNYFNSTVDNRTKGFLGLLANNQIDKIIEYYENIGVPQSRQKLIRNNLLWLQKRAMLYSNNIDRPYTPGVNGWHDSRTLFGGRVSSWLENYIKRLAEQYGQLEQLSDSLIKLEGFVSSYLPTDREYNDKEFENRKKELINLSDRLLELTQNIDEIQTNPDKFQTLTSLHKDLRRKLNEYFQLYYKDDSDKKSSPAKVKELEEFWKLRIYKPRSFYGYAQRERLQKIVETTIPTIKTGIQLTKHLIKILKDLPDYSEAEKEKDRRKIRPDAGLRRLLEALRSKIKDDKLNTNQFRELYIEILQKYVPKNDITYLTDERKLGRYTFYKSEYSTSTQHKIELSTQNYSKEVKNILNKLIDYLDIPDEELLDNPKLLLDFIETSKFVIARLFRWMDQDKKWDLKDFKLHIFPAADKFIKQLEVNKVKTPMLRLIIMSQMFSEFRGSATVYSKKYLTAKWIVQLADSDEKFKLGLTSEENDLTPEQLLDLIKEKPKESLKTLNWIVRFQTKSREKLPLLVLAGKEGGWKIEKGSRDKILQICTSRYHLQFLERLIYKPQNWQDIQIRVSEPSLIVEERYQIKWNWKKENNWLEIKRPEKPKNKPVLYYALPMQFTVKRNKDKTPLKIIKNAFDKNPEEALKKYYFLGADIGEYGIAWVIVQIDKNKKVIDVKEYGFEYDRQIQKIQKRFKDIQHKARTGVFLEDTTVLAKLRENAIGYLRNKLHNKLINYGGHIIYEANISGFEVGVGRITKIYDSVKRADIGNHPDMSTNKKQVKQVWGLVFRKDTSTKDMLPGWQVGAAGTSYTCINCGQTIYGLGEDKNKWIKLETIAGSIHKFKHPSKDIVIFGYKETKKSQISDQTEYKELRGYARNFARPPLVKTGKEGKFELPAVTEHFIVKKNILAKDKLQKIKNKRGNSAIFVCPFDGCHAVVDADIQAALVIAIRGYLYLEEYYLSKVKTPFENSKDILRDRTIELLQNLKLTGRLGFVYYSGE